MNHEMPSQAASPLEADRGEDGKSSGGGQKSRRRCIYCLLFLIWLFISIGLFIKMMESRHDKVEEAGELKPWHFVNTEE